jgi:hypothetical protein
LNSCVDAPTIDWSSKRMLDALYLYQIIWRTRCLSISAPMPWPMLGLCLAQKEIGKT